MFSRGSLTYLMADVLRPELVVGLIGPVGCGLQEVVDATKQQLDRFGYDIHVIKVSGEFRSLSPWATLPTKGPRDDHYDLYMDAATICADGWAATTPRCIPHSRDYGGSVRTLLTARKRSRSPGMVVRSSSTR